MIGCPYCGLTHNIGLISTRFAGTDGVSLEAAKWADVFEKQGCRCYYFGGELDTPPERSYLVEEAHFRHPDILNIYRNSIEELLEDLPQILVSAIRARIVREQYLI